MERPRGSWEPLQRQVTGEVMYIQDRWQNGQQVGDYTELPEGARRMYEDDAALLLSLGGRPSIFDLYDEYDQARSELSRSCEALAEELLKFRDVYSNDMHEIFAVPLLLPREVYAKLEQLRVAEVLARDDEQLAKASPFDERVDNADIRKADSVLTDVSIQVWKHSAKRKRVITADPHVEPQYPRDFLTYPSSEVTRSYRIEISFDYYHPTADQINETVGIYVDEQGDLSVVRDMYVLGYDVAASEGEYSKVLADISQQDVAALADLIAEIVGDEPRPMWRRDDYDEIRSYISRVPNGLTRAYLTEWIDNTSSAHVRRCLSMESVNGITLRDALIDAHNPHVHGAVVALVDDERRVHNGRFEAAMSSETSKALTRWRDRIER